MGDDYHRPTYTTPDFNRSFNPTQVRLYGIPGLCGIADGGSDKEEKQSEKRPVADIVTGVWDDIFIIIAEYTKKAIKDNQILQKIKKIAPEIKASRSSYVFIDAIIKKYKIMFGAIDLDPDDKSKVMTSGIIFGYAYEGHAYDFPKPKIMLIPAEPETRFPDDDSGYFGKRYEGYAVWIVDKLDQCVEIEVNQGFVEQLVLEANLPGKRSPNMYAGKFQMGHRGGRLTD